jgi:Skp family chaperone for outer membrane proteins
MGNIWLLIAAPAAVLAAILFWRVFDIQHADYEQHRAEVREERAKFNADFAKAWDGKADPALEAKAAEEEEKRKKLEADAAERKRKAEAAAREQVDKLDALLNTPTTTPTKEK